MEVDDSTESSEFMQLELARTVGMLEDRQQDVRKEARHLYAIPFYFASILVLVEKIHKMDQNKVLRL